MTTVQNNESTLEKYYQFHAKIYDLTRWSFLFGREAIIRHMKAAGSPANILEVGCGTGINMVALCKVFPEAHVTGIDVSPDMIDKAKQNTAANAQRVTLLQQLYQAPLNPSGYDAVLLSYSLTMMNPGWEHVLEQALEDLAPGGMIAVADFHDSRFPAFKRWMGVNHVRMDGHLLPKLEALYRTELADVRNAYAGLWTYLEYIGRKN